MLFGQIEAVTTAGFVDGWAFDDTDELRPLNLAVFTDSGEVARGQADRYRADLVMDGRGMGWCCFHLRLSVAYTGLAYAPLRLRVEGAPDDIAVVEAVEIVEAVEHPLTSVAAVLADDPTLLQDINQLSGCERLFAEIVAKRGVAVFLNLSCNYLLDRPVQIAELIAYADGLRQGVLSPLDVLKDIHDGKAFQVSPRRLAAPTQTGFAFRRA